MEEIINQMLGNSPFAGAVLWYAHKTTMRIALIEAHIWPKKSRKDLNNGA